MKAEHSYRVDGSTEIRDSAGHLDKTISVRGDYVRPDRLEIDLEGLDRRTVHQVVIVGEKAYQRERHGPGIRGRTDWEELHVRSVDPLYLGGVPDLPLDLAEYLFSVNWTSIERVDGGARIRGWSGSEGSDVVTYHHMLVRDFRQPPFITRRHWVHTLEIVTTDHNGSERVVLQKASYKFSLYLHPLEVREPRLGGG